jgi:hypothetical protein
MSIEQTLVKNFFPEISVVRAMIRLLRPGVLTVFIVFGFVGPLAAESLSLSDRRTLLAEAEKLGDAFEKGDADYIIAKTHPSLSTIMGGKENFEDLTRKTMTQLAELDVEFIESSLGTPSQIYPSDKEIVCFVPKNSLIKVGEKRIRSKGFLIAARAASGGEWLFLDGAGLRKNPQMLWKLFPALATDIELPENTQEVLE